MPPEHQVHFASIDMTLALGAESHIRRRHPGPENLAVDPVAAQCLTNLIELVVNSEVCFLALPSHDDYQSRPALIKHLTVLKRFRIRASIRMAPAH
jgi:hypothetical protein